MGRAGRCRGRARGNRRGKGDGHIGGIFDGEAGLIGEHIVSIEGVVFPVRNAGEDASRKDEAK